MFLSFTVLSNMVDGFNQQIAISYLLTPGYQCNCTLIYTGKLR